MNASTYRSIAPLDALQAYLAAPVMTRIAAISPTGETDADGVAEASIDVGMAAAYASVGADSTAERIFATPGMGIASAAGSAFDYSRRLELLFADPERIAWTARAFCASYLGVAERVEEIKRHVGGGKDPAKEERIARTLDDYRVLTALAAGCAILLGKVDDPYNRRA